MAEKAAVRFDSVSKKFVLQRERARSFQEAMLHLLHQTGNGRREEFWALRDVSFEIGPGEAMGFVGPNGAGKSTVLKLISRIFEPTKGRVAVQGKVGALLELGAGFHPELTGRENIFLKSSMLGVSRTRVRQRLDEIIAFAELERFIDVPVKHYSSGMAVRLAFSVAVHTDPQVLLVDEVLAVGDQNFQRKCMDRIQDMRRAGTTILLVSHNNDIVARMCERVIWLEEGRVVDDGPARDMVESYLVSINEKDRERLEKVAAHSSSHDPSTLSPEERAKRFGSGEVCILDVTFLDSQGAPREVFLPDQPMTIRVTCEAMERVENPVFGIGLYRDDNLHIAGPNTSTAGYHIPFVEGRSALDFVIPSLSLMAGRYELTVSVYDETMTHKYALLHRAFSFSVQPRSVWDSLGVMRLPGHWSLQSDVET